MGRFVVSFFFFILLSGPVGWGFRACMQADDGVGGRLELSDGGIGRKALSAHTKSEDNRRQFFQLYRRMARQVRRIRRLKWVLDPTSSLRVASEAQAFGVYAACSPRPPFCPRYCTRETASSSA